MLIVQQLITPWLIIDMKIVPIEMLQLINTVVVLSTKLKVRFIIIVMLLTAFKD